MNNIADSKVQKVTGHKTLKMTDHYTHFDARQFTEVRNVQEELLALPDNTKNDTVSDKPKKIKAAQTKNKPAKKTDTRVKATA